MAETKKETKTVKSSEKTAEKKPATKKATTKTTTAAKKPAAPKAATKPAAKKEPEQAKPVETAKVEAPKAPAKPATDMIEVTLEKSGKGRLEKQMKTLKALGLNKTHSSNIVPDNAATRGMIYVVRHLVSVKKVK